MLVRKWNRNALGRFELLSEVGFAFLSACRGSVIIYRITDEGLLANEQYERDGYFGTV
jgi:hypothetical protein